MIIKKKKQLNIYRQGDLGITSLKEIPEQKYKITKVEKSGFVLAYGESTGHKHLLVKDRPSTKIEILEDSEGRRYLKIENGKGILEHEQHKTIKIEPGFYIIEHEREFDYFKQEKRQVID